MIMSTRQQLRWLSELCTLLTSYPASYADHCDLIMLPVWQCYLYGYVTWVTTSPVWLCYLCDNVTCMIMLSMWQCYLHDNVTCVTMSLVWQCHLCGCYLCGYVTCMIMSPAWLCYLHDNVTYVTMSPVWLLPVWLRWSVQVGRSHLEQTTLLDDPPVHCHIKHNTCYHNSQTHQLWV